MHYATVYYDHFMVWTYLWTGGLPWVIISSDNDVAPVQSQAITWTNDEVLLTSAEFGPECYNLYCMECFRKMSSVIWQPFCLDFSEVDVYIAWILQVKKSTEIGHVNTVQMRLRHYSMFAVFSKRYGHTT